MTQNRHYTEHFCNVRFHLTWQFSTQQGNLHFKDELKLTTLNNISKVTGKSTDNSNPLSSMSDDALLINFKCYRLLKMLNAYKQFHYRTSIQAIPIYSNNFITAISISLYMQRCPPQHHKYQKVKDNINSQQWWNT